MAVFGVLYNSTVSVKPYTGQDDDGDPTYGAIVTGIDARVETGINLRTSDGLVYDNVTKVSTEHRQFAERDLIFLSGDGTGDDSNGREAFEVGADNLLGVTSYWAVV